jgi:hypothetical protein
MEAGAEAKLERKGRTSGRERLSIGIVIDQDQN